MTILTPDRYIHGTPADLQETLDARDKEIEALRAALTELVERLECHGNWDDGCFYYSRRSAPELERPLTGARAALAKVRP